MEENDIEQKQTYLRLNIIDKGYDPNSFYQFLYNKKGDASSDLTNWTIPELEQCVKDFQAENNPSPLSEEPASLQEPPSQPCLPPPSKPPSQIYQDLLSVKGTIPCSKSPTTVLSSEPSFSISISSPEKVEGGYFTKSYITYLIQTSPFNYQVRKRYSDFEWLRQYLMSVYIGSFIPPIPRKNYGDRFNEYFISKRMRKLEKFMQTLAMDPLIGRSAIFADFISVDSEKEWSERKAEYTNHKLPSLLSEVITTTGNIVYEITPEKEMYFKNIKDNINNNEGLLKKILVAYKALLLSMDDFTTKLSEISEMWKQLRDNSEKYYENRTVMNIYGNMAKLSVDWAETLKRQGTLLNSEIKEYFKYVRNEFRAMRDLTVKCDNSQFAFRKGYERLEMKKEYLYGLQDISKWGIECEDNEKMEIVMNDKTFCFGIMLPKETEGVLEMKKWYGFYLQAVITEYERLRDLYEVKHKKRIQTFSKMNIELLTNLQMAYADLVSCSQ